MSKKRFKCEDCGKTFTQSSAYYRHRRGRCTGSKDDDVKLNPSEVVAFQSQGEGGGTSTNTSTNTGTGTEGQGPSAGTGSMARLKIPKLDKTYELGPREYSEDEQKEVEDAYKKKEKVEWDNFWADIDRRGIEAEEKRRENERRREQVNQALSDAQLEADRQWRKRAAYYGGIACILVGSGLLIYSGSGGDVGKKVNHFLGLFK